MTIFPLTPRLQQHVGIPKKSKGDKVNLEVDVLGKYVERSLSSMLDRLGALEDWKMVSAKLPVHVWNGFSLSGVIFRFVAFIELSFKRYANLGQKLLPSPV